MKQTVTVLGIPITVNTSSTDPKYLEDTARYIEETAKKISKGKSLPTDKLLAMIALALTDEIFTKASSELPDARRGPARVEALINKINEVLEKNAMR